MKEVLRIAQRPKYCRDPECCLQNEIWGSAQWRQLAPVSCTYGNDVIAQIGRHRQVLQQPFAVIYNDLSDRICISETQVRALYHYRYLPLLACHEQQQLGRLQEIAQKVGLLLTLDGLAPEGGEPQLWLVRELLSGTTLRSGWMSEQNQAAFVHFLQPIADLGLRVTAVLSDKQSGLLPAVAEVFPQAKHAFCQIHYLRNIALPLAEADEAMKVRLRQGIRESLGEWIRQEKDEQQGVLTVTGLLPSPVVLQSATLQTTASEEVTAARQAVLQDLCRRIRYLLTLKARPPFRLAGIEMVARLTEVDQCLEGLIASHATPQLVTLQQKLHATLHSLQATSNLLVEAAQWLKKIADLLEPEGQPSRSGEQIRQALLALLDEIQETRHADPFLRQVCDHIQKTTRSYAPGLFHCYDVPGPPRTNNERESEFRDLYRRLLRTTGQKALSRRIVQRQGAWELIPHPPTLPSTIQAVSLIAPRDFHIERQRLLKHRDRFRLHTRSAGRSQAQLQQLEQRWAARSPDTS